MDRDAGLRFLALQKMVAGDWRTRQEVIWRGGGEPLRIQHLFALNGKQSVCGQVWASETIAEKASATVRMCPVCMESAAFREGLRLVMGDALGVLPIAPGFSVVASSSTVMVEQPTLPEEFLPTGSGRRASSW